jgi:hypothetical protein
MLGRSKRQFEEEQQEAYYREQAYLNAEKELKEKELMQQLFEEEMAEQPAKIVLGKVRKASKFGKHARVSLIRKVCRKPVRYKS